jgi:hypothetical protein
MYLFILFLGLFAGRADYSNHTWAVNDHVVGHSFEEDSDIRFLDGTTFAWEG